MASNRKTAPKADYTQQADTQHVLADSNVATNLLAVAGKPKFAPQLIVFVSTAGGTVTLTPEKGANFTLTVPAATPLPHTAAVKATVSATGTVVAHIYWWDPYGSLDWNLET